MLKVLAVLLIFQVMTSASIPTDWLEGNATQRSRLNYATIPSLLTLQNWKNSNPLSWSGLRGKIVIINYWATWCDASIDAVPLGNFMSLKYRDDLVYIGVCNSVGADSMDRRVLDQSILYPIAVDNGNIVRNSLRIDGSPDYYIFDRDGSLIVSDIKNSKVRDVIELLIKK